MNKVLIIALIVIVVVGVSGYLIFINSQKSAAPSQEQLPVVSIAGFAFNPATLQVKVGTTVTWTNNEPAPHTITSANFVGSGTLAQGQTFNYTFTQAGDYEYFCSIHPSMRGKVQVSE
jgi:plastocyanin